MRKDPYRIGDGTFAFSPAVFDSLLGHGAKGAARMRELAGAMHVSISSIKDWRRGTHAPSDFAETAFGEDDGKWLPDPDMIFDPHEDGYVSPMEAAELKCRKLLDEIRNDLLALRPTAGK